MDNYKYEILADMSGDIIFEISLKSGEVSFSESLARHIGVSNPRKNAYDIANNSPSIFDEDREELITLFKSLSAENPSFKTELRVKTREQKYVWYELYAHSLKDDGVIIGKLINIDRCKRETDRWRRAAAADPLTKLFNKRAFNRRVACAMRSSDSAESAMFFIDLDNFKSINDTFGHQFGDEILLKTAEALKKNVRVTDIAGRIGGDEFAVFLNGIGGEENIILKAELLSSKLRFERDGHGVSASIGIAKYPQDAVDYDELLSKADKALYHMKKTGKAGYIFYSPEHEDEIFSSRITEVMRGSE